MISEALKLADKFNFPPVKIEINENVQVTPTNVMCPRDVHIQIRNAADEGINYLLAAGVIAESNKPTTHCAHGMF